MHFEISWVAVLAAAVSAFVLGGLWYGPLFGKAWQRESGLGSEHMKGGNMPMIFGGSFVLNVIAAAVFDAFLPAGTALPTVIEAGAAVGIGLVATAFGVSYLFARKSLNLFLIDGGYMALRFVLFGLVIGLIG